MTYVPSQRRWLSDLAPERRELLPCSHVRVAEHRRLTERRRERTYQAASPAVG